MKAKSTAPAPRRPSEVAASGAAKPAEPEAPAAAPPSSGTLTTESARANWHEVIKAVGAVSKVSGALLANTAPLSVHDGVLAVAFPSQGMLSNVIGGQHMERITAAVATIFGVQVRIDPVLDPGAAKVGGNAAAARDAVDTGDADPEDAAMTSRSAMDMVTEALGGRVISETPRES